MKNACNYLKYFTQKNRFNLIAAVIATVLLVGFDIGIAFIIMMLVDIATYGDIQGLMRMMAISGGFIFLKFIISFVAKYYRHQYIYKALLQYKNKLFDCILNLNANNFSHETTSKYISAFSNDLNTIELNFVEAIISLTRLIFLLLLGILAMFYLNVKMTFCVILSSGLTMLISVLLGKKIVQIENSVSMDNEKFVGSIKDILSGFSVIKSFKADKEIKSVFREKNSTLEIKKKKRRDELSKIDIISNTAGSMVLYVVFGVGAWLTVHGELNTGAVLAFVQLLNYVINPIQEIPPLVSKICAAVILIKKQQYILQLNEVKVEDRKFDFTSEIRYDNVCFGYDEKGLILNHINLVLKKGRSYAVVGASGSGKSTLMNLLLGYHYNYTGNITIDGTEIRKISNNDLYEIYSVIQQNIFIFDGSIKDNITMFKEFKNKDIEMAVKLSNLQDFVNKNGLDYNCGENGCNLSGGERQRISIARGLLKRTPIILMDEATAALDNTTSYSIEQSMLSLDKLTRIVITHKMNEKVLRMYDEIIVIKNGEVAEVGTFDELIKSYGQFYSLYNILSDL